MGGLITFFVLGFIGLLWLCLIGCLKLEKAQEACFSLLKDLEKSSQKLKGSTAQYPDAMAIRGKKAISSHLN